MNNSAPGTDKDTRTHTSTRDHKRLASGLRSERGSMAPLMLGLAALSLALILIVTTLGSAFIFQRRLVALAEAKALSAIADGPEIPSQIQLTTESQSSTDGQTIEVRVCAKWQPPLKLGSLLQFANLGQTICASGLSRLGK